MFWNNFEKLCVQRGISPNGVCKDLGFSNATATHWKQGAKPNNNTVKRIADYFGVSVDYLLGREASIKKEPAASDELSVKNVKFIGRDGVVKYKKLTPEMISMLEQLPDSDEDL